MAVWYLERLFFEGNFLYLISELEKSRYFTSLLNLFQKQRRTTYHLNFVVIRYIISSMNDYADL